MTTQEFINTRYDHIIGRNGKNAYDVAAKNLETRTSNKIPQTSKDLKYNEIVKMDLAMLFVDITGYTDLVKNENPKKIARVMTLYVTEMGAAIRHHGGIIVSIEGDGLLASFNTIQGKKHNACEKAVRCAVTMNTLLDFVVNKRLREFNYNTISCRYGMDFGPIIINRAGIKGEGKNELLFIGKATNHAAKFLGIASNGEYVISEEVYKQLSDFYRGSSNGWSWSSSYSSEYGNYRKRSVSHWKDIKEAE